MALSFTVSDTVSEVLQCKLVPGRGLKKRQSALPSGTMLIRKGLCFLLYGLLFETDQ